ncbi:meiotic recombination protein REC8 homolog [Megalopta genalis]|uniref:meiotic recombination protein REC8 homolog n=1 Tax=Megalopta genalis TaxID=115081 RepID=UPI003FD24BF9
MFYVPELLSLRRRGKLARCWLAATLSEQMFKKKVKQSTVQCIDISILCEEILSAIQTSNGTACVRFSLYLSSQLLYGAVKLLFYQTKILQDNLFAIYLKKSIIGDR